jgi:hypothetical protein
MLSVTLRLAVWAPLAPALALGCGASAPAHPVSVSGDTPAGPPQALSFEKPFIVAGEQLTFELSLRGIVGGEAVTVVGQPGTIEGKHVVIVRSRVESGGLVAIFKEVHDDVTTWIDVDSGYPVYLRADLKFGKKEQLVETRFADGAAGSFEVSSQDKGEDPQTVHQLMPSRETIFDSHAVVGAIRAWRARQGAMAYFYVLTGRHVWESTVRFTSRETVETALGKMRALRIDGVARRLNANLGVDPTKKPRQYTLWISDDGQRLPLLVEGKTEYGEVRAELVKYKSPFFTASR